MVLFIVATIHLEVHKHVLSTETFCMPGFLSADTSEGQLLALLLDNLHLGHSGRAVNDVIPKHLQDDLVRLPQGVSLAALGMHHSTGLNLRDHIALGHGALLKARTTCLKNSNRGISLLFLCHPAYFGMPCTFACCTSRESHYSGLCRSPSVPSSWISSLPSLCTGRGRL